MRSRPLYLDDAAAAMDRAIAAHGGAEATVQRLLNEQQHGSNGHDMRPEPPSEGEAVTPQPPQPRTQKLHPLLQAIRRGLSERARATEFALDLILQAALAVIAGSRGVGKTSCLLPLLAKVTHLGPRDELTPLLKRRLVWITEDIEQALLIRAAMWADGLLGDDEAAVHDMLRVVPALRMSVDAITDMAAGAAALAMPNRRIDGSTFDAMPVVVFDTRTAVIDIKEENDNSEASAIAAKLKQRLGFLPLVIIGHVAKQLRRADIEELSTRGADAIEADANQVAYVFADEKAGGGRYMRLAAPGKRRFHSHIEELRFLPCVTTVSTEDALGNVIETPVLYCTAEAVSAEQRLDMRKVAAEQREQNRQQGAAEQMDSEIAEYVQEETARGNLVSRSDVEHNVRGGNDRIRAGIRRMLRDRLFEHDISGTHKPVNNKRTRFLVLLTYGEQQCLRANPKYVPVPPPIPASWGVPK